DALPISSSTELDICDQNQVRLYLEQNDIGYIIHAAALARLTGCENAPAEAIRKNIIGTSNLVSSVLSRECRSGKSIRFLQISSDGVYEGTEGGYTEDGPTIPKTNYGWSKLGAECAVRLLDNYCIIRTRFFDKKNIPFETSASDIYTSKISLDELVLHVYQILLSDYIGVLNVGGNKISDFDCHKNYKLSIKECLRLDIVKEVPFEVPKDISMDTSKFIQLLDTLNAKH
ncbi:MAG TPA: hypothetical protein DIS90_09575, partial [Cytophagales bacterium]|nr:hypothetical protein [Cytophagales bacterium]